MAILDDRDGYGSKITSGRETTNLGQLSYGFLGVSIIVSWEVCLKMREFLNFSLGGGFKHFLFSPLHGKNDPI